MVTLPASFECSLQTHHAQFLGSAYALGASSKQMTESYEHEITQLVPLDRGFIRGEAISRDNWGDYLTRKESVTDNIPSTLFQYEIRLLTKWLGSPWLTWISSTRK